MLPEDAAADAQLVEALREELGALDEPYREVLRQRFYEEQTTLQIAHTSGCAHGTIRWRVHEGLQRVRVALDRRFGGRSQWLGGAIAIGGLSPESMALTTKAMTMAAATTPKTSVAIPVALAILAATAVSLAITLAAGDAGAESAPGEAAVAVEPATDLERAREQPSASEARVAVPRSTPAPAAEAIRATVTRSRTRAPAEQPEPELPAMTPQAYRKCADDAVARYNVAQRLDVPAGSVDDLFEAARCYQGAGMVGMAIRINKEIEERHGDTDRWREATEHNEEIFEQVLVADAALGTPAGRQCVAPLEDDDSGDAQVAAAECLYSAGFIAAARRHRELATESPILADAEDNQAWIDRLDRLVARVETVAHADD